MRRIRAALGHGTRTSALVLFFLASTTAGVVLHANLPPARRVVERLTNAATEDVFAGRLLVEDVRELHLVGDSRVHAGRVRVLDPEGRTVLVARDVRARIRLWPLVTSLVYGGVPVVDLEDADVNEAEVVLDVDASGTLGIERAFAPKAPPPSGEAAGPPPPQKEDVVLRIPRALVRHAWVHGNVAPPALDADASQVHATIAIEHDVLNVKIEEAHVTLRSPRLPEQELPFVGVGNGEIAIPLTTGELTAKAELRGDVGGIPVDARASLDKGEVDAAVDVEEATPEAIARAFPSIRVRDAASFHATVKGTLPEIEVRADARVGRSEAHATASYEFRAGHPFRADLELVNVDASAFGATPTDVSGRAHVEGAFVEGGAIGSFRATTRPARVDGRSLPPLVIEGRFEPALVTSTVRAEERGVYGTGKLVLDVPKRRLTFDAQARTDDLARFAPVSGGGSARAQGSVDLDRGTITAKVNADGTNVRSGAFSAGTVRAEASVTGPVGAPTSDVIFDASDVRLTAPGKEPLVHPHASGSARVVLAPSPRVESAEMRVGDGVHATAERIDLGKGGVAVHGARVTGLGAPIEADVHTTHEGWRIRIKASDLDVHRAAALTGIAQLEALPKGTRASIDVDLVSRGQGAEGYADVELTGEGPHGEVHARISGQRLTASAHAEVPGLGYVDANATDLFVPDVRKPMRAAGSIELRGAIDLAEAAAFLGDERIERIRGVLAVEGRVERASLDGPLHARATATTRGLDVLLANGRSFSGADGSIHLEHDSRTEETELAISAWDDEGVIATAGAKARLPLEAWATGKKRFDPAALETLETNAVAVVPERPIQRLPFGLSPPDKRGRIGVEASLAGHLGRPRALLHATLTNLRDTSTRDARRAAALDGVLDARWDGDDLVAVLGLDEREENKKRRPDDKPPAHVRALGMAKVRALDVLRAPFGGGPVRWRGSAEVDVADLEIAPFPLPYDLQGVVTGRARVRDIGGTPSVQVQAKVDRLGVRGADLDTAQIVAGARDGSLFVSVRAKDGEGNANLQIASRAFRFRGLEATFDGKAPTRIDYDVKGMRLAILRPLVRRVFPEFDGRVDGRGSATVDETSQVFEGGLSVTDGRFYVTSIGEEITQVRASARFEKSGAFKIENATGKAGSGQFVLNASGNMQGFRFRDAEGVITIPSEEGVPLSSEGATFAEATGEVRFQARMTDNREVLLLTLDVPRANIELPQRDTQALQELDPEPTIAVGIRQPSGKLEPTERRQPGRGGGESGEEDVVSTKITIGLGDDVVVEGRNMRVTLRGKTVIDVEREVAVTGQIDLRSGTIEVHGRRFTVDRGTITWPIGSEPDNPTIVAAAYWDAPDRTRIWVEFTGPLKKGSLTLRSEPPFSKNEILSILLFGRPDPNIATPGQQASDASRAAAVGTGFVAADVNSALSQIDENLDYETDTLSGNRTRTKVGYRLRRNLRVQLGYAPGRSYREPDTTFLFIDWQFVPKWSLVATRGDRGTSILDVLFQHRY